MMVVVVVIFMIKSGLRNAAYYIFPLANSLFYYIRINDSKKFKSKKKKILFKLVLDTGTLSLFSSINI